MHRGLHLQLDKALFDLDLVATAADEIGFAVGRDDLADIGGLPGRVELRLLFPEIKHPAGGVLGRLQADIGDEANDRLTVHVAQIHQVLADQRRVRRMEGADAVDVVDEQIEFVSEPARPLLGKLGEGGLAFPLHQVGGIFDERDEALCVVIHVDGERLVRAGKSRGRPEN